MHVLIKMMRQMIRSIFLLFLRISGYKPPKLVPSDVDVYELNKRVRFLDSQENEKELIDNDYYVGEEEKSVEPWNQNIDPVFYDRKELSKVLETKKNVLENVWNSRILYESTPRGNIVMFYDVYKEGFSYYSDQTGIPYKILNAVAMKYVITFRCRDFFMDETISSSPFIKYNKDEEKKEQDKKNETMKQLSSNNQSLPFVRFKNRQTTTQPSEMMGAIQPVNPMSQQSNTNVTEKEYVNNRFIYKGRMHDWSPLQKPPLSISNKTQEKVLDYKTFRNSRAVSVPMVSSSNDDVIDEATLWRIDGEEETEETEYLHFWRDQSYKIGLFGSL